LESAALASAFWSGIFVASTAAHAVVQNQIFRMDYVEALKVRE